MNACLRALFVVCLAAGLAACSEPPAAQGGFPTPQVDVSSPISANITEWDEYTGRFAAVNGVEIRARVSGYLQSVNFRDGQFVEKGAVLFVIDQRPFQIALNSAKSRFELAKKELDRSRDLRRKNSISQEEVDRRLNEYQMANAELERAKLDMEFTEVKAPIGGLVSRDLVNEGNLVNGSANNATLLTTVVSINPIHFYFEAGERDLLKYQRLSQTQERESSRTAANPVKVRLQDENEYLHEGVMDFVDNQVDQSTGTIQGRAILENDDGLLLPGLFGRVRLLSRENVSAILVPDSIIGTNQSVKFVYVLDAENRMTVRPVQLGKLYTQDLRVVASGLGPDDRIVVNGLLRARPGMQVETNEVDIAAQYPLEG